MKKEPEVLFKSLQKREMSSFMAEQLLYDYATKKIDPVREKAVADVLTNSPELAKKLDDIIYGMTYCHHLQQTTVSPEFIKRFKARPKLASRIRKYKNLRHWNQSTLWILEAVVISLVVLFFSMVVPWPKLFKLFVEKQNPTLIISESPKDKSIVPTSEPLTQSPPNLILQYRVVAELGVVNPEFTSNKLLTQLPSLGASIEHQSLRPSSKGIISPFLRISIPTDQSEALFSELKTHGQLTFVTPPSENEKGSKIFGIELWINKVEPPKGAVQPKDKNGE